MHLLPFHHLLREKIMLPQKLRRTYYTAKRTTVHYGELLYSLLDVLYVQFSPFFFSSLALTCLLPPNSVCLYISLFRSFFPSSLDDEQQFCIPIEALRQGGEFTKDVCTVQTAAMPPLCAVFFGVFVFESPT